MTREPIAKFWMVYRDNGGPPSFRHYTKEAARQEAARLSEKCPGNLFFVLAVVDACECPIGPVESVKLRKATEEETRYREIPF